MAQVKRHCRNFNPLSPCGERRNATDIDIDIEKFQSTLPVWGETKKDLKNLKVNMISIHSPRVGRDLSNHDGQPAGRRFQSTLPVWGETGPSAGYLPDGADFNPLSPCGERHIMQPPACFLSYISIHSPRVGRDFSCDRQLQRLPYFNPLSPCGERLQKIWYLLINRIISIHSPRVGRDQNYIVYPSDPTDFNPLSPCGERQN